MAAMKAAALALSLLLAACGSITPAVSTSPDGSASPTAVAEPARIRIIYNSPDAGYMALWVGQDSGIFKRNGLDVQLQLVSNGTQSLAALLSGQAQFIQTGGSTAISPAADGADLTLLSVVIPVYSYMLEANPSLKQPTDLKGQKLAVSSLGDSGDLATRVALRKLSIDPDKDVSILSVGSTPVRAAALRSGAVQAAVTSFPENLALERDGFNRLIDLAALKLPAAGQSTIAQKSWVASHRDVTQRYVDSLIESLAKARQDRAGTIATIKKAMKTDDDAAVNLTYDYYIKEVFPQLPVPDPQLFKDALEQLSKGNDKIQGFDVAKLIDPSFVDGASKRGVGN
jgi:NitT/TauT family transport system substrate-binding protein